MKPSSAKQKGRKHQQHCRDRIVYYFPELVAGDHKQGGDVLSTSMGAGGEDIRMSPAARACLPISIECKSLAAAAIYNPYHQAEENAGDFEPVVFIRANREPKTLAVIDMEALLQLYKEVHDVKKAKEERRVQESVRLPHWAEEAEV